LPKHGEVREEMVAMRARTRASDVTIAPGLSANQYAMPARSTTATAPMRATASCEALKSR